MFCQVNVYNPPLSREMLVLILVNLKGFKLSMSCSDRSLFNETRTIQTYRKSRR